VRAWGDTLDSFDVTLAVLVRGIGHVAGEGASAPAGVHDLPESAWRPVAQRATSMTLSSGPLRRVGATLRCGAGAAGPVTLGRRSPAPFGRPAAGRSVTWSGTSDWEVWDFCWGCRSAFGVLARVVAGRAETTTRWLGLFGACGFFVAGLLTSEVWSGWATEEDLQPNVYGLSFDEALLAGLLGGIATVVVTRLVGRSRQVRHTGAAGSVR